MGRHLWSCQHALVLCTVGGDLQPSADEVKIAPVGCEDRKTLLLASTLYSLQSRVSPGKSVYGYSSSDAIFS